MSCATIVAILVVTTLTHWPRLGIGTPQDPGPDTTIHMVAFGLLTAGVWASGWIRSPRRLWLVGVLWSAADEITQGLPGVARHVEWEDWAANAMGVTVAIAWILATMPVGGWHSRRRRAARDRATAEVFQHWWAWLVPPLAALLGAVAAWPLFAFIGARSWAMPSLQVTLTGMIVLGLASALASIEITVRLLRPSPWPALPDRTHARLVIGPVLAGLALLVLLTALAQAVLLLRPHSTTVALIEEWYRRRPQAFRSTLDLALILLIAAWSCRRARRRVAARVDLSHRRCLRCDQDLRGAARPTGAGLCPECGAPYELPPDERGASGAEVAAGGRAPAP